MLLATKLQNMAENAPGLANAGASNGDANRGLPYYDQLRDNLRQLLTRKRILDRNGVSYALKTFGGIQE